jgi:hypothetical protein
VIRSARSDVRLAPSPNPLPEGEGFELWRLEGEGFDGRSRRSPLSRSASRAAASIARSLASSTRVTCTVRGDLARRHRPHRRVEGGDQVARSCALGEVELDRPAARRRLQPADGETRCRDIAGERLVDDDPGRCRSFLRMSVARSSAARFRVPSTLPEGLPDCPGTNRPRASRPDQAPPPWPECFWYVLFGPKASRNDAGRLCLEVLTKYDNL